MNYTSLTETSQPKNQTSSPSQIILATLFNKNQITHPKEKHALTGKYFYAHKNYEIVTRSLGNAFSRYVDGYQWCFAEFRHDKQAQGAYKKANSRAGNRTREGQQKLDKLKKEANLIRSNSHWKSQQVFVVEIDEGLEVQSLEAFVSLHQKIIEDTGVFAVAESLRSGYDDPNDDTCIGKLKVRFFHVLPQPVTEENARNFLIEKLNAHYQAQGFITDPGGSKPTTGALSKVSTKHIIFNRYLNLNLISQWNEQFKNQPPPEPKPTETTVQKEFLYDGNIPQWLRDALAFISADDYQGWQAVGSALKHGGYPFDLFDTWSQSSDKYNPKAAEKAWETGYDKIPFDYIIKVAKKNGWKPEWEGRKRYRLDPTPIPEPTETWEDQQPVLEQAFKTEADTVLIRFDTGVGKDYQKISNILSADLSTERSLEMVTRIDLANEKQMDVAKAAEKKGLFLNTYVWKGIHHNYDQWRDKDFYQRKAQIGEFGQLMCCQADLFDALRRKGATPQLVLCPTCPVKSACEQHGYLSQTKKAQQADYLLSAQDGLLFDKSQNGFAKTLMEGKRAVIGIVDEVKAHELYSECSLSKDELRQMMRYWENTPAGEWALSMVDALEHTSTSNYERIRQITEDLSEAEQRLIINAFTTIRLVGTVADTEDDKEYDDHDALRAWGTFSPDAFHPIAIKIAVNAEAVEYFSRNNIPAVERKAIEANVLCLSYIEAIKINLFFLTEDDAPLNLKHIKEGFPKLYQNQHHTPLHQLQTLFEQYPRTEDTPIHYNGETLKWSIPPEVHPKLSKVIMMSATADTQTIADKVLLDRQVEIVDANPTKWMSGNEVFQVRTGKYPRASVLNGQGELIGFGEKAWEWMKAQIERAPAQKHAVITYKSVVERYRDQLPENVVLANYGAAEGENDRFKDCNVFWILFDPRVPPHEVERRAKMIFGRDEKPLDYTYLQDQGIYADERLQQVADHYAIEELTQAIGRARLVRRTGVKVVILCGRELPGISARSETMLFQPDDLTKAEILDNLASVISQREAEEKIVIKQVKTMAEEEKNDKAILEELNINRYRLEQIKQDLAEKGELPDPTAEKKEQAIEMRTDRKTYNEIAERLEISGATAYDWTKSVKPVPQLDSAATSGKCRSTISTLIVSQQNPNDAALFNNHAGLCDVERQILDFIALNDKNEVRTSEILEAIDAKERTIKQKLTRLMKQGYLIRPPDKSHGYYALAPSVMEIPSVRPKPPEVQAYLIRAEETARASRILIAQRLERTMTQEQIESLDAFFAAEEGSIFDYPQTEEEHLLHTQSLMWFKACFYVDFKQEGIPIPDYLSDVPEFLSKHVPVPSPRTQE